MNHGRASLYLHFCWYSLQECKYPYPVCSIPVIGTVPWHSHWWSAAVRSSLAFPSWGRTLSHGSHSRAVGALANKSLLISASRASFWSLKNLGMSFWSRSRTWIAHHASLVFVFAPFTPNRKDNWFQPRLACTNHLLTGRPKNLPYELSLLRSLL